MRPIASAISSIPHLAAFHDIVKARLDAIDKSAALVNMIDTVPVDALPHLARQYHIMGFEGWKFATTEEQRRAILRKAVQMHRYKGTPWSIKEALKTIGYNEVTFQEGVDKVLDGTWNLDGETTLGATGWAKFIANIGVEDPNAMTEEQIDIVAGVILEYKPVRCHLISINFYQLSGPDFFTIDTDHWTIDTNTFTIDKTIN